MTADPIAGIIALLDEPGAAAETANGGRLHRNLITGRNKSTMNIKEVKDLIQEILQSDISSFELEHTGTRVKIKRGFSAKEEAPLATQPTQVSATLIPPVAGPAVAPLLAPPVAGISEEKDENLHVITSPIVGTFYRTPAPGTEYFVKIGSLVEEGTILCIVEAMKLMNEIPSDIAGEVARIYVENGQPVEYGQKLFGIILRR